ncbi:hypothetical protein [Sphingomonas melonis]|uniref:Uncharacterized protein n=1 Tax=Sphingomonas melonis TaxID=152682 RepID=A0A7Y9FK74_9SPHN|nr:hypothetical protein [Sphingomonas melonis]NYD88784.1 hypothetical protein [Sphingomonas melonis]
MNAVTTIAANDPATTPVDVIADRLLAGLALVPSITDYPTALYEAKRLASRVRGYANLPNTAPGMLGRNGIQPAIERCIISAGRHGFNWRTPEALTDAVYAAAGGR